MAKRLERVKPWQAVLFVLFNVGGALLFWMLLSPEEAGAGGTIAVVAVVAIGILLTLVSLAIKKAPPPSDQPPESDRQQPGR